MSIHADLIERTMHLSPADRAELASKLILSLESEPPEIEQEVEREWEEEIQRRLDAYDRGETTSVQADEAIARIRSSLRHGDESK